MNTPVLLLLCSLVLFSADASFARKVTVSAYTEDGERSRRDLLRTAFREAVLGEALDILPAEPAEDRLALLADYFSDKSDAYVLSYSELGRSTAVSSGNGTGLMETEGDRYLFDVDVNRAALKSELQALGIFYTLESSYFYDLRLGENASAGWSDIGAMQRLSGLRVKSGSTPVLSLEKGQDGLWVGALKGSGREWRGMDKDLRALWVELWREFFARPEVETGLFESVEVSISGWFTPDGVRAFDDVLLSWDKAVESAVLISMGMTPTGISARWSVKSIDRMAFMDRLEAYLPSRGLSYGLDGAQADTAQEESGATFQDVPDSGLSFEEEAKEGLN
jgi:hypothetical protein